MARIKIEIPAEIIGELRIPVRITDLNYGNHVGNDALVSIIHEARVQWLNSNGYSEFNIGGCGMIMADLMVEYLGESFYGDIFTIKIAAVETGRASFELYYAISTTRAEKEIQIARARTGMVCYNYELKKVALMPDKFKALLGK